jgi:hypothetical protein
MIGCLRTILRHVEAWFWTRRAVQDEISRWTVCQNAVDPKSLSEAHDNDDKPPNTHYTKERCVGVLLKLYQPQEMTDYYTLNTYGDVCCKCIVTQTPEGPEIIICRFLGFQIVEVKLLQDGKCECTSWIPCRHRKQSGSSELLELFSRSDTTSV